MLAALRRIPAPLLVAQLGAIVGALYDMVRVSSSTYAPEGAFANLVGSRYAIEVLSIVGLAWLARGLEGAPRFGARIAMFAIVISLASSLLLVAFRTVLPDVLPHLDLTLWFVDARLDVICAVALGGGPRDLYPTKGVDPDRRTRRVRRESDLAARNALGL